METLKKLHFVGVGGAGLSAVCLLAKNAGFEVSGCDQDQTSVYLNQIRKAKIKVEDSHNSSHVANVDALVVSPAIESLDPNNPELMFAKQSQKAIFLGEEFLANYLLKGKKLIAVAGTHGKSTTTAMIGFILEQTGLDPTILVGAIMNDYDSNLRIGKSDYFVLEADEYREKFLLYQPFIGVVTAVEMDHPEYFKDFSAVKEAFTKFAARVVKDGFLLLGKGLDLKSTGAKVINFEQRKFNLKIIGGFNQANASIAFQAAQLLGVEQTKAFGALAKFSGVGRRFEFKGEEAGIKVFDDYAHHPSAIEATVRAAKEKFPDSRVWLVYQPHMYTRTAYLFDDFVETFKKLPAEMILLVDIFAARQENKENVSSMNLVKKVGQDNVKYIGDFENTAYFVAKNAVNGDVILVMGAGNIYQLSDLILKKIKNRL